MSVVKSRRAAVAALALALATASCGGDEVLGTPDIAACTAGTLTPGAPKAGAISEESCSLWFDYYYDFYQSESWTVNTRANTTYIVRVVPTGEGAANTWVGDVALFRRNAAGDPVFAGGNWGSYGPVNVNGGRPLELIFGSPRAMTVSVRVLGYTPGPYEIELLACPTVRLAVGGDAVTQEFTADGCALLSEGGQSPAPTPVRFWSFEGDSAVSYTTTVTRTAGTSNFRGRVRGPDLDFGCYLPLCTTVATTTGAGPYSVARTPSVDGTYTVAVYQQTAGTLTASVRVVTTAGAVMSPTAAAR
jgi:hypothetical protein